MKWSVLSLVGVLSLGVAACSDDDGGEGAAGSAGAAGVAGSAGAAGGGGAAGVAGSAGAAAGGGAADCSAERTEALGPIDGVSSGQILTGEFEGQPYVYVDATAGGFTEAINNPALYVRLSDLTRVDVSDLGADSSTGWDLAFKRDVIRVNGGDSGPGAGAVAVLSDVAFDDVTADRIAGASFATDEFIDGACQVTKDAAGKYVTSFSNWYDYDGETMRVTPKPIVFLVRPATGSAVYKLAIRSFYGMEDGSVGGTGAHFLLRIAKLRD